MSTFETEVREAMASTAREIRATVTAGEKAAMAWDRAAREGTLGQPPSISKVETTIRDLRQRQYLMTADERSQFRDQERQLEKLKEMEREQKRARDKQGPAPGSCAWHFTHSVPSNSTARDFIPTDPWGRR